MQNIIKLYTHSHNYSNTEVRRTTNSLNPTMVFDNMHEHSSQGYLCFSLLGRRDDPKRGRLAGREAALKFFARPLERSACFDAILGKSSPKKQSLSIGERLVSQANLASLFMAKRIFFLLNAENWKFAEPNKHSDCSTNYKMCVTKL